MLFTCLETEILSLIRIQDLYYPSISVESKNVQLVGMILFFKSNCKLHCVSHYVFDCTLHYVIFQLYQIN